MNFYNDAFKKAKQMQEKIKKLEEELDEVKFKGTDIDNYVTIYVSGNKLPIKIELDKKIKNDLSVDGMEEAILKALIQAYEKSEEHIKKEMSKITEINKEMTEIIGMEEEMTKITDDEDIPF